MYVTLRKWLDFLLKSLRFLKLRAYYLTVSVSSVHQKERFFNMDNI